MKFDSIGSKHFLFEVSIQSIERLTELNEDYGVTRPVMWGLGIGALVRKRGHHNRLFVSLYGVILHFAVIYGNTLHTRGHQNLAGYPRETIATPPLNINIRHIHYLVSKMFNFILSIFNSLSYFFNNFFHYYFII